MKMKTLSTTAIKNELVKVRYLKRVRVPALRKGEVGEIKEMPRAVAYRLQIAGKVEIVQDGKSKKRRK